MIKEIKFTDKALKQINHLLSSKDKGSFLESLLKVVVAQVFNMIFHSINQQEDD